MTAFDNYDKEVKERWGDSDAYRQYSEKTAGYSNEDWKGANDALNAAFSKFALCKQAGNAPSSPEAQALAGEIQACITEHYYTCTKEILAGLGQMYLLDERFKQNLDKHGEGTAQFISEAIKIYCK